MGKVGRICCIFTPFALTLASFICLLLLQLSGWSSPSLNQYYFFQADFSKLDLASAGGLANSTELTAALTYAKTNNKLAQLYQIHLWNYCYTNTVGANTTDHCTEKQSGFIFDPVNVWFLNATATSSGATATSTASNAVQSSINNLKSNAEGLEDQVLGSAGAKALDAYRSVAHFMFIAYEVSFWTSLATIPFGILAIFSRWGSFLTWICSLASSLFTFAAVLSSTILFGAVVGALGAVLHPYKISLSLSTHTLIVAWLAVVFSWGATSFWLMSVCCCSGKSNPHHKSNKGGLLYGGDRDGAGAGGGIYTGGSGLRGRDALRAEKTGSGGYQRVASPYLGAASTEHVPLQSYPQATSPGGYPSHGGYPAHYQQSNAWEPYRHH